MKIEERIRSRFEELINSGDQLKRGNVHDQVFNEHHRQKCIAWLASAQNIVHLVVSNPENPYRASVDRSCATNRGFCAQQPVGEVSLILKSLLKDIDLGLLASIEDQTRASVFDDFLDYAKEYAKQNIKTKQVLLQESYLRTQYELFAETPLLMKKIKNSII